MDSLQTLEPRLNGLIREILIKTAHRQSFRKLDCLLWVNLLGFSGNRTECLACLVRGFQLLREISQSIDQNLRSESSDYTKEELWLVFNALFRRPDSHVDVHVAASAQCRLNSDTNRNSALSIPTFPTVIRVPGGFCKRGKDT